MKKIMFMALVFGLILRAGLIFSQPQQEAGLLSKIDLGASGSLDFYSQYIWRGFALDTDPVIQPGFSLSGKGFTFSWWSSQDAGNNDILNSDEIDYTIDYTKELGSLSFSLGHTYYDFSGANLYSREFYVGLGAPEFWLSPALTYYRDYGDEDDGGGDGDYLAFGISHSFSLAENPAITLDLGANIGYNHELFIKGCGGNSLISAGVTIPLARGLAITPSVNYSIPFAGLKDADDGKQEERFYGGISLSYTFG